MHRDWSKSSAIVSYILDPIIFLQSQLHHCLTMCTVDQTLGMENTVNNGQTHTPYLLSVAVVDKRYDPLFNTVTTSLSHVISSKLYTNSINIE